jgi:hypothetical protein
MRSALLLSGDPRFCKEFDSQLDNLKNSEIDWFVVVWKRYAESRTDGKSHWIPPSFRDISIDDARNYIESRLPYGHKLAHIELIDPIDYPPVPEHYESVLGVNINYWFYQLWILNQCDLRRQQHNDYDLIIRSRVDIGLNRPIYLDKVYETLMANKPAQLIYTPNNLRAPQGWSHVLPVNDMFAVGLPEVMKIYTDTYNLIDLPTMQEYYDPNVIISKVWSKNNIHFPHSDFEMTIRTEGVGSKYIDFIPNFGKWE